MLGFRMGFTATLLCLFVLGSSSDASALFDDKFETEAKIEQQAVKLVREARRGDYDVVAADELKQWIDQGRDMVIVDTMPLESGYKRNHVPGAVQFLFPVSDMDQWDAARTGGKSPADYEALLGPDKDRTVVVYCSFVKCPRSHNGAMWARKLGYRNVFRFPGGIFAWKGSDFPLESE